MSGPQLKRLDTERDNILFLTRFFLFFFLQLFQIIDSWVI